MKLYIEEEKITLQATDYGCMDEEETDWFKYYCNQHGIIVKENKLKHLSAFAESNKLYELILHATIKFSNVSIH